MADQERWQLGGEEPQRYERNKVPGLFRPLAERFIEHLGFRAGERVLDVACGTGIVARLVVPRVGPSGRVVGVDLNAGMLAVARGLELESEAAVEWREGDAEALPFPDAVFDTVLCQQGLQFFPNKLRALDQMRRVLVPDGRLALSVWGEQNAYAWALSEALHKHISADAASRSMAILALRDLNELRSLVLDAGFKDVAIRGVTIFRRMAALEEALPLEVSGTPFAAAVLFCQ